MAGPAKSANWRNFPPASALERALSALTPAARAAGVSRSTFSAAENGKPVAIESYIALTGFIGLSPYDFTACGILPIGRFPEGQVAEKECCPSGGFPGNAGAGDASIRSV